MSNVKALILAVVTFVGMAAMFVAGVEITHRLQKHKVETGNVLCIGAAGTARPKISVEDVIALERTGKASFKITRNDGSFSFIDMDTGMCVFAKEPLVVPEQKRPSPEKLQLPEGPSV